MPGVCLGFLFAVYLATEIIVFASASLHSILLL